MKILKAYIISALIFISFASAQSQNYDNSNFYIGIGTGISTYLGGYFGNAYAMKVMYDYYDDYYDDYYYSYNYNYDYDDDYNNTTIWSPLQFDITAGFHLSENLSVEFNSTFLFSFDGLIDPQFVTGTVGNRDFIDRNGYSSLYSVPVSAALKFHAEDEYGSGFFFKFGPAFQYTSEEYDRIREYYYYDKYGYYYSDFVYLYTVSKSEWLPGFTASTGISFQLSDFTTSYTELAYSYFKINGNNETALALDRAIEAQLFSLNTKLFFNF